MIPANEELVKFEKHIKFEKPFNQILRISTAINGTICFLGILESNEDCLTHMDGNGHIIKQKVFAESVDSFAMLSEREVMVLETRRTIFWSGTWRRIL